MARTVKCPSCGGELTVKDANRDFIFCEYCGTKVRLDDYQETHDSWMKHGFRSLRTPRSSS